MVIRIRRQGSTGWERIRNAYYADPSRTLEELARDLEIDDPKVVYERAARERWPEKRDAIYRHAREDARKTIQDRVARRAASTIEELLDLAARFLRLEFQRAIRDQETEGDQKPVRRVMRKKLDDGSTIELETRTSILTMTERRTLVSEALALVRTIAGLLPPGERTAALPDAASLQAMADAIEHDEALDRQIVETSARVVSDGE